MQTALVLGGTGSLSAAVECLARDGWQVTATGRNPRAVPTRWAELELRFRVVDRNEPRSMAVLVGGGFDLLVDGQCYTPAEALELSKWSHYCGSAVMLSARAVYVDSHGRHLNSEESPQWNGPTKESQPTMRFDGEEFAARMGYGANKAEAERVLMAGGARVSILRPSKIHGPNVRQVREWPIIQRVLDARTWIPVRDGDRVESTTSTAVIADAVVACAKNPASRLLNVADADPQPARRLAALVARAAGADLQQVDVDLTCPTPIGLLPWNQDNILDTSALHQLGVQPATFADTIQHEVEWVTALAARGRDRGWRLPPWLQIDTPDYHSEERCRPV